MIWIGQMPDPYKMAKLALRGAGLAVIAWLILRFHPTQPWMGSIVIAAAIGALSCISITQRLSVLALGLLLFIAIIPPRFGVYLWGVG